MVTAGPVDTRDRQSGQRSSGHESGGRNPLLRNGHMLSVSSAMTSLIGFAYWAVVAHHYDTATVGRNAAAISMMMLLGGVSQLNLMSAMTRFVPVAGRWTRSLVLGAYGVSVTVALAAGLFFVLMRHSLAPDLATLIDGHKMMVTFVASTMAWCIFVLQDSVLTGLRKAQWVASENTVFALTKVGVVVVLASAMPRFGIFVSWSIALVVSLAISNTYLFVRAIPAHMSNTETQPGLGVRAIVRFTSLDYIGALAWILATTLQPILIINALGPTASAYFSIAWLMASSLYFVSANMGVSLVVETAVDQSLLGRRCWEVIRHTAGLIMIGVVVLVLGAHRLLQLFGADYGRHGTTVTQLLALSALPNVVTATAISACRAQRRTGTAVVILVCLCGSVLVASAVLLPVVGIIGVAYAWLGVQTLVAAGLGMTRRRWLPTAIQEN
jgi:O-antigen/teichoic acid export membrane protein